MNFLFGNIFTYTYKKIIESTESVLGRTMLLPFIYFYVIIIAAILLLQVLHQI